MSIGAVDVSLMARAHQAFQAAIGANSTLVSNLGDDVEDTADTTMLSPAAEGMLSLSGLFGTEPGQPITLDVMQRFAEDKLESFEQDFRTMLRENDIDTSEPITLGHESGTGRLIVTNDHPDAEKIESLLAERPDLRNQYTAATTTLGLAKQGQQHTQFAQAYGTSPQAAVAQYAYLFNSHWEASVTVSADSCDVAYNRVFG